MGSTESASSSKATECVFIDSLCQAGVDPALVWVWVCGGTLLEKTRGQSRSPAACGCCGENSVIHLSLILDTESVPKRK